jgi:isopenicillin-N epimerase
MRALEWKQGDSVLYLSTAYPMVVHTLNYLKDTYNVNPKKVDLTFPITSSGIIDLVEQAILQSVDVADCHKIRTAVFCHVTSLPSIILPVEELVGLCHRQNILVLIDGAHAPGISSFFIVFVSRLIFSSRSNPT